MSTWHLLNQTGAKGAGYVFSKDALNRLGAELTKSYAFCNVTGNEDVDVGACFKKVDVSLESSLDEEEKERFNYVNLCTVLLNFIFILVLFIDFTHLV